MKTKLLKLVRKNAQFKHETYQNISSPSNPFSQFNRWETIWYMKLNDEYYENKSLMKLLEIAVESLFSTEMAIKIIENNKDKRNKRVEYTKWLANQEYLKKKFNSINPHF